MKISTSRYPKKTLRLTGNYSSSGNPLLPAPPVNVCNMNYLDSIARGNQKKAGDLAQAFVTEVNDGLELLEIAIEETNFPGISDISHKMKSAFAILGIKILEPVIKEMERLSNTCSSIEKIKRSSHFIRGVFKRAKAEIHQQVLPV